MALSTLLGFDSLALLVAIGLLFNRGWLVPAVGFLPNDLAGIERTTQRLLVLSVAALWLSSLAWLWARTAAMSGQSAWASLSTIPTVLFRSHFGEVWWLRVAAMGGASLALAWSMLTRWRHGRFTYITLLFWLAWVCASRSAAGHAAADGHWTLREGMDWLHLVSVSAWGGSLIAATLLVFPRLHKLTPAERACFARRFSRLATWALLGVLVSGSYGAWQMLPALSAFWTSHYGRVLGFKLLLVAGMLVCGALNHFRLVPGIARPDAPCDLIPARRLQASVLVEAVLLLGVLVLTAILLNVSPPAA